MSSLSATNEELREAVFRTKENQATPASQPTTLGSPFIQKIKIYTLPADVSGDLETAGAFHLLLIVAGTSSGGKRDVWHNYVATLASACFPGIKADLLQNPGFVEVIIPASTLTKLKEWYVLYSAAVSGTLEEHEATEALQEAAGSIPTFDLPTGGLSIDVDMDDVISAPSIYGHFSLVLFLGAKAISDKNRVAITQKRPGAIEGKYFERKVVASLSGSLKLSSVAHSMIHASFTTSVHLRRSVYLFTATLTASPLDQLTEIVATTTRLMRFAGMQQAIIIDRFLAGHPEAFEVPFLIPAIQAYNASMRNLRSAPEVQRPFYKVIHGDTTRAFNRNDILNLLAVALVHERQLNPTLLNYEIPTNHQLVMEKYEEALQTIADTD